MQLWSVSCCVGLFFFFFSSRRRHTRFDCDWSSDVCSSDLVIGTRLEENQTGNQFGTFIYPSLAALAADSPAMFTRTVVPRVHPGTAWNSALYAGDTWRVGGSLRLTYGARLEAARFSGAPLYNRAVDSLFGGRTDRIPSEVHV